MGKKQKNRLFFLLMLFMLGYPVLSRGDELESAKTFDKSGKFQEAAVLYGQWLRGHTGDKQFVTILSRAFAIEPDPVKSLTLLKKYIPSILSLQDKKRFLEQKAELEELLGNLEEAQRDYQAAALLDPGAPDFSCLWKSANLLLNFGEYEGARHQLWSCYTSAESQQIKRLSQLALCLLFLESGNKPELDQLTQSEDFRKIRQATDLSPLELYALYEIACYLNDADLKEQTLQSLKQRFPQSPELKIIRNQIDVLPIPRTIGLVLFQSSPRQLSPQELSPQEEGKNSERVPFFVQSGAFLEKKNAQHMLRTLTASGFSPVMKETEYQGGKLIKVLIPVRSQDESQAVIIKLKELGIEAYLCFEEK